MKKSTSARRTYGGQTTEERRAERRARLVAATVEVLGAKGEGATTMTAICAAAGLTERYFYESFTHRDDALLAALDSVADRIASLVVAAVDESAGSPSDRVRAALTALVDWAESEPGEIRVALTESDANPSLRSRRHQLLDDFAKLVATEATRLYGADVHPRAHANGLLFAAGIAEIVTAWTAGRLPITRDEVVALGSEAFERLARA